MKLHTLFTLLLALLTARPLTAGAQDFRCTELPNQHLLPVPKVSHVLQDREGYMWYGTQGGGVCRDDGYTLHTWNSSQRGCKGIESDEVTALAEGPDGRIWVGTRSGMYYIDKQDGSVHTVDAEQQRHRKIQCMAVRADGAVWFGVERKVVLMSAGMEVLHEFDIGGSEREEPKNMMIDHEGTLWVCILRGGLRSIDKDCKQLRNRDWPLEHAANYMLEDTVRHCYWVGTWGSGVVGYPDMQLQPGTLHVSEQHRFGCEVNNMVIDYRRSLLWTSTVDNLYAYRIVSVMGPDNRRINTLIPFDTSPFMPQQKKIIGNLAIDRRGQVWVPGHMPHTFIISPGTGGGIRRDPVQAMEQQIGYKLMVSRIVREGDLYWIYQDRTRLSLYDSRSGQLAFMATDAKPQPLSTTKALARRREGRGVWTCQGRRLLHVWNEGMQIHWQEVAEVKLPNYIASLNDMGRGELLIGTERQVFSYNYHTKTLKALTDSIGLVQSVGRDAKGTLQYTLKAGQLLPLTDRFGHTWQLTETSLTETSTRTGASRVIRPSDPGVEMEYFTDLTLSGDSICLGGIGAFCMVGHSKALDHAEPVADTIVMVDDTHVSTLNPLHAPDIRFAYRFSDAAPWRYLEPGKNELDLSAPGSAGHTLQVMATDDFGRWSRPQQVSIPAGEGRRPWWPWLSVPAIAALILWHYRRRRQAATPPPADDRQEKQRRNTEQARANAPGKPDANPFLQKAAEAVMQNLDNPEYGIENLCADLGMSRMNMYRKFQGATAQTPSEFIRTIRLRRGAEMLLSTDRSVAEVAYAVGFTSPQYFTKCFKEDYGTTPKKFKNSQSDNLYLGHS